MRSLTHRGSVSTQRHRREGKTGVCGPGLAVSSHGLGARAMVPDPFLAAALLVVAVLGQAFVGRAALLMHLLSRPPRE